MFECIKNTKGENKLIHNISNYVTAQICADTQSAVGARPFMADAENEVEEITSKCDALNLNIGTLNNSSFNSMQKSCKLANKKNIPILLDPVGLGSSDFRRKCVSKILDAYNVSCICGNFSEIKCLLDSSYKYLGVDANINDEINSSNIEDGIKTTQQVAKKYNCVVIASGKIDLISNENKTCCVYNGHEFMGKIIGSGCQLSALTAAFIASNKDKIFEACCASALYMSIAGQLAAEKLNDKFSYMTYRNQLIDCISSLGIEEIKKSAKYEIR